MAEQRNRIVHDLWDVSDIAEPKRFEASARKKLRLEKIHVPTREVLLLAEKIDAHRDRFRSLASRVLTEREPLRKK